MFDRHSRYYYIENKSLTLPDGTEIMYKARRLIPQPEQVPSIASTISDGKRVDQLSYTTLGAPGYYWKIGDANPVFSLTELEVPGTPVRLPTNGSNR